MIIEYNDNKKEILNEVYKILVNNMCILYLEKDREYFDNEKNYEKWSNSILKEKNYKIITYSIDKEIIGFLSYTIIDKKLWISEVQIKYEYKNKGILKSILKYFIGLSIIKTYNEVYLHINSNNKISQEVFTHIGFKLKKDTIYTINIINLINWVKN